MGNVTELAHQTQDVCLEMGAHTMRRLKNKAGVEVVDRDDERGLDVMYALGRAEYTAAALYRIRCSPVVLEFIREKAPEMMQHWPAVFAPDGNEEPLVSASVGARIMADCVGVAIAGVHVERTGEFSVWFENGARLIVPAGAGVDFVAA